MKRFALLIMMLFALAACAGTPGDATATRPEPTPTREIEAAGTPAVVGDPGSGFGLESMLQGNGFVAQVSGDAQVQFIGIGVYECENETTYALRPTSGGSQQLTLIFPADITPGTYTLAENESNGISASVMLSDGRVYAGAVNGVVVLNSVATRPGQEVSGSFDFTASNGSGQVAVRGEFKFTSAVGVGYCG